MAKRPSGRAIRAARTYTIEEAASALGVSTGTIRNWVRAGLPIMKAQRPFLILGEALRDFLQDRASDGKVALQASQLYCLTCKAGRSPMGNLVDCIPQTATTARLMGLCEVCSGTCNRMISRSQIDQFGRIFELVLRGGKTA
jgi:excisionase family DNA binding protein